ncbi:MAG: FAD-dependent oxidoreductase [Dongiaceae bacterium]
MNSANGNIADIIVVGGGGAGLAAAIEGATLGRSVILLEKNDHPGGTTAWSVGVLTATATPQQVKKGIKDSPTRHQAYMLKSKPTNEVKDNPALCRILTENLADTVRWLTSLGVEFFGPIAEPPHKEQRLHLVVPNARAYIFHCTRRARRLGVDIRTGMRVIRLISDGGRVKGVVARSTAGGEIEFAARGGVVLASGDYAGSADLKKRFISAQAASIQAINPSSTGDGQLLGEELGGYILNGSVAMMKLRFVPPPRRKLIQLIPPYHSVTRVMRWSLEHLPTSIIRPFMMGFLVTSLAPESTFLTGGGVLVNKMGSAVLYDGKDSIAAFVDQPEQRGFVLCDDVVARKFDQWPHFISTAPGMAYTYFSDYRRSRPDLHHSHRDVKALALLAGMDPAALVKALEIMAMARRESDPAKGLQPPFHLLGPMQLYITTTNGGLAIDEKFRILRRDGTPIAGLFGAGSAGQGGALLQGHGHHIGWAFTSGRLAGRNAAFEVVDEA